jgi:thiamine-phosphate pyrophosphorylase
MEDCRFSLYTLESELLSLFSRTLPPGIYGILGEKFSRGRSNIETAEEMAAGGVSIIQYREKTEDKSFREIFRECRVIREITLDAKIPFIINDFVEIAVMVEADGIHQGQGDLPVEELRKHVPHMMIGCSTHSPEQARKAVEDGADYIGVGPLFPTTTKEDVCDAVGLSYLEYVAGELNIPYVAIGGIKRENLGEVIKRGATTICLVTEILEAENITDRIKEIQLLIQENS